MLVLRTNVHCLRLLNIQSAAIATLDGLPGDNSEREPPDPISNSEVKLLSADDSVAVAM